MDPAGGEVAGRAGRSLTKTAASGVAWTSAVTLAERVSALAAQLILATLLPLETWGSWGVIVAVTMFVSGFASTGIREVLIHRSSSFRLWSGPALWFSGIWGFLLTVVLLALAWPVSMFVEPQYHEETLIGILVVAPTAMMQSMFSVPRAKMAIEHRFKESALIFALPGIAQLVLTIVLAMFGLRMLALAIPYTISALMRMCLMLWFAGLPRIGRPRVRRWRYFVADARRVWVETVAVWLRTQGDVLIVGVFVDQATLGLYAFARNMSRQMVSLITNQVAGVMQPMLVTLREDASRMLSAFMRASRLLAFLGVPMTLGIGAVMWPGTALLLDEAKWAGLPAVLSVMAFGIAVRMLTESAVSLKFAIGRFREQQRFSVVSSVAFAASVGVGAWGGGAIGASVGYAAFCLVAGPLQFLTAVRPIGGGLPETFRAVFLPVILGMVSIAPWVVVAEWLGHATPAMQAVDVAMVVVCSAVTYFVLALALRLPELRELAERLREQSPGRFRPLVVRLTEPMMVRGGRAA